MKTKGRPKGSTNIAAFVDIVIPGCPFCGSHSQSRYTNPRTETASTENNELEITSRATTCLDCGKQRRDRFIKVSDKRK